MILRKQSPQAGFTLVEMMTASGIAVMLFAGMLVTLIAQQRGFVAALYQMDAQGDESRVMAYISRDLRNATSLEISAEGTEVTLVVPDSAGTSPLLNSNLGLPLLSLLTTTTGTTTKTISYYREGTSIIRQVGNVSTSLSSSATQFQVSRAGTAVTTTLQFQPSFSLHSNSSTANGTQVSACVYLLNSSQP